MSIGAWIGLGASVLGAGSAKKAANRQADAIMRAAEMEDARARELAAPWLKSAEYALPALRNFVQGTLAPNINKESAIMRGQHQLNVSDINKNKNQSLAKSSMFWNKSGNTGKARGESLAINQMATDSMNRENLSYGAGQEQFKQNSNLTFMNALNAMSGQGQVGLSTAMSGARGLTDGMVGAAGVRAQGSYDLANGMGTLGGTLFGNYLGQQENSRLAGILAPSGNTASPAPAFNTNLNVDPNTTLGIGAEDVFRSTVKTPWSGMGVTGFGKKKVG